MMPSLTYLTTSSIDLAALPLCLFKHTRNSTMDGSRASGSLVGTSCATRRCTMASRTLETATMSAPVCSNHATYLSHDLA